MSEHAAYALGVDYGTNSVRALVVDVRDGTEVGTGVFAYPSGEMGVLLDDRDPNLARQHPGDYLEGFVASVRLALAEAARHPEFRPERVLGIGVDTTGSSPMPVNAEGIPLGMTPAFRNRLDAQCWLWKDHTSYEEAAEITRVAKAMGRPYLDRCGGTYSSEWFWAKILHCARVAPDVMAAAHTWVELADFVPAAITGNLLPERLVRGICAAGHKAMFATDPGGWDGLPDSEFLAALDPALADLRPRLYSRAVPSDQPAGRLSEEYADLTGLPAGTPVATGAFDAHHGAVGVGIRPGVLVKIMGTSSCDIAVVAGTESVPEVPGLCGVVPGSVTPGDIGVEAGQSAVGDLFAWFVRELVVGTTGGQDVRPEDLASAHARLTSEASRLEPGESGLLALDWNNGNRCVLVDPLLSGLLVGQTLHTTAAEIYRALIEATAFGSLIIVNRIEECGVRIEEVIVSGGIAEKSPLTMGIYADVLNRPIRVGRSAQSCALGAAVFGAVVGGAYGTTAEAQRAMTGCKPDIVQPNPERVAVYRHLFHLYTQLHDAFGVARSEVGLAHLMKDLLALRRTVRGA